MKKKLIALLCVVSLVGVFALTACGGSSADKSDGGDAAADDTVYTLKVSTTRTEGTWYADFYDELFAKITEDSNGRLQFEVHHNNSLGAPADIYSMFQEGAVDIMDCSPGMIGSFTVSNILNMPGYFSTDEDVANVMWALYDAGYLTEYTNDMEVLAFLPNGGLQYMGNKDVESMADFAGMKLRGSSQLLCSAIELFGATAVSVQNSDITMSLQQGVLDGLITGAAYSKTIGLFEDVKYIMDYDIAKSCMFCGINNDSMAELPEDLQEILRKDFEEAYSDWMSQLADDYKTALEAGASEDGITVYQPSESFQKEIEDTSSTLMESYKQTLTDAGMDADAIVACADAALDQ